jgi:hypothetical protein
MRVGGAPAVLASSSRRPRWIVERGIPVARITTAIPPLTERARLGRAQYRRDRSVSTGANAVYFARSVLTSTRAPVPWRLPKYKRY